MHDGQAAWVPAQSLLSRVTLDRGAHLSVLVSKALNGRLTTSESCYKELNKLISASIYNVF